jgi:hypothetical protein
MFMMMLMAQGIDPLVEAARTKLSGERGCVVDPQSTDITVCGLRQADRFRVPFIVHDAGDPRREGVQAERVRLLHRTTPLQDLGPFQVGGGHAGVSVTTSADGTRAAGLRRPAP